MGKLDSFDDLKAGLQMGLDAVQPGVINTMYWHDSVHNYGRAEKAEPRIDQWNRFLTEVIDPLVAEGKVQWATFSEMTDAYLALEADGSLALADSDEVEQLDSPHKYGNLNPFIKKNDKNNDGALDRDEFTGPPAAFDKLDKDGDGFLRNNEIPRREKGGR